MIRITVVRSTPCKLVRSKKVYVQERYGNAAKSLLLRTERQNLIYVLSQMELREEEESALKHRLAIIENELLQTFPTDIPW